MACSCGLKKNTNTARKATPRPSTSSRKRIMKKGTRKLATRPLK